MADTPEIKDVDTKAVEALAARVTEVEKSVTGAWAAIRKVIRAVEKIFGIDIDRDGKVGGVRLGLVLGLVVLSLIGVVAFGATVWDISSDEHGTLKAESSSKQITLTTDKVTVTNGLTVSGGAVSLPDGSLSADELTGNIAVARLTNALPSSGSYIGGNIPEAALTNAAGSLGDNLGGNIPLAAVTNAGATLGPYVLGNIPLASVTNAGATFGPYVLGNIPLASVTNAGATLGPYVLGNIPEASVTNAAASLGDNIGGNIPVASITNAAGSVGASIGGNIPIAAISNAIFDAIGPDQMADADHGDFTWASGVGSIDNGAVTAAKIDPTVVTNVLAAGMTLPAVSAEAITNMNGANIASGNIDVGRITNALTTGGASIGGNIPQAALTNALSPTLISHVFTNIVWDAGATTGTLTFVNGVLNAKTP